MSMKFEEKEKKKMRIRKKMKKNQFFFVAIGANRWPFLFFGANLVQMKSP